MSVCDYNITTT